MHARLLPSGYSRPIYLARRGNRQARQWRNRNAGIQRRTQPALSSLLLRACYAYGCPFHIQDIRARPPPPRDEPAPDPLLPPCRRLRRNEYQDPRWFRRDETYCINMSEACRHQAAQIFRLSLGRNLTGETLPRVSWTLDELDGFHRGKLLAD